MLPTNSTLKKQRILYFSSLAVCLVLIALGESNVFIDLQTSPDSQETFALEIVTIFSTLAALPIAVKVKRTAKLWLIPLCFAIVLICYYITLSTYSVLCLAIIVFALLYIFPRPHKDHSMQNGEEEMTVNEE